MSTKIRLFRRAFLCLYLRRVDFVCINIDWNFDDKSTFCSIAFDALTFGALIFSYQKRRQHYWICSRNFMQLPFDLSIFCASISARMSTKIRRLRRAFWCIYLRRVDFLCMNMDWNFDEKWSILAWFFMHLPSACRFFRIKNDVEVTEYVGNLKLRFRNFWKLKKQPKWTQIHILFFVASGTGKIVSEVKLSF